MAHPCSGVLLLLCIPSQCGRSTARISHLKPHLSNISCLAQVNPIQIMFCHTQVYDELCFAVVSYRTWACLILNLSIIPVNLNTANISDWGKCAWGFQWSVRANIPLWYPLKWCNQAETPLSWKCPLPRKSKPLPVLPMPCDGASPKRWEHLQGVSSGTHHRSDSKLAQGKSAISFQILNLFSY